MRAVLCPDKIDSGQWFEVMAAAHAVGLKATSTIMFGHVDTYTHWARHLLKLRDMQERTGVFTEFVPLPFVAEQSPIFLKRQSRSGPSAREAVLMHAVARIVLGASFRNIQTSWVKMGPDGAARCLQSGANDLGGTLMYESITRSAGGVNGSEMTPDDLARIAGRAGRQLARRTTQYQPT